jgi:hypothetical protein
MHLWKNYYLAYSIPNTFEKLFEKARLIAGGTDFLLELQGRLQIMNGSSTHRE